MKIAEQIKREVERVTPILKSEGLTPENNQLHISGEREVFGFKKLVLVCKDPKNKRVVVKCSRFRLGKKEIRIEKKIRDHIKNVPFADDTIAFPKEILYKKKGGYILFATEYIDQEKIFVDHSIEDQFFMVLGVFESLESFHANTFEHLWNVRRKMPVIKKDKYQKKLISFQRRVLGNSYSNKIERSIIQSACDFFIQNADTISTYCCYLVHEDFVPHNFRIHENQIYLLDYSSFQYGNKYESWSRFVNYMTIHNPKLEKMLTDYVKKERGENENISFKIMRIFKILQLLDFYSGLLKSTSGNLLELTKVRISFWTQVLKYLLEDKTLPEEERNKYITKRDSLRSKEEKERQREFAQA